MNILAKENPNSFARMPDFRAIGTFSHQTTHPRRKTSHFFCEYPLVIDFVHNSPRFTDNRLPSAHVVHKTRHFTDKGPHITIALPTPPRNQNKRVRQRNICRTLYSCTSGSNRRGRLFAYRLIIPDASAGWGSVLKFI